MSRAATKKSAINGSRSKIRVKYMTQRNDDKTSHKFLQDMSAPVAEHLRLMDFGSLSARITKSNPDLLKGDFQPIFVANGKTVSETDWENKLIDDSLGNQVVDNPAELTNLQDFISSTLDKYIAKNEQYGYNDLPYRLFRVAELYECSDADVVKRLEIYKSGVKKYLELSKKDANVKKDLDNDFWQLQKIKDKIDIPEPPKDCLSKFSKLGACPIDFYYGVYDVPKDANNIDLSDYQMESLIDYFLEDTDDYSCYKYGHLRQSILGLIYTTRKFLPINKFFHTPSSTTRLRHKYPEITWDPDMNDIHIKCIFEHLYNLINNPIFPLRIYTDDKYINIGKNPEVSRYDYVAKDELDKMTYLGCFLVPVYLYFFKTHTKTGKKIIQYIEPSTSINGSANIEAEFRRDITYSKTGYDATRYISRLSTMVNKLTDGNPDEYLSIRIDNSDFDQIPGADEHTTTIRIKRRQIRKTVAVYNFHLFKKDDKYNIINYRSNIVKPGFIMERFKFLYIEMHQIYYILTRIYKQPSFRLHRYSDTNLFFFSPYYDNGQKHSADNEFEKKKLELQTELLSKYPEGINIDKHKIQITPDKLTEFYEKLVPYDVFIDPTHGKSIYLQPINKLGGSMRIKSHNITIKSRKPIRKITCKHRIKSLPKF